MNVLTGELCHETNTFNAIPTTLQQFEDEVYLCGRETILKARRGTRSGMGGVIERSDELGWHLHANLVTSANPTGSVTAACFDQLCAQLLQPTVETAKFDGVLLLLHGAMVTEDFEDAEGEILRRVRDLIGPTTPIVVTLDLHGNVTPVMAQLSNCLIACRTYPHVDFYEMAKKAADLLQQSMLGTILPTQVIAKRPMLHGLDRGRTFPGSPMQVLIDRGEALEMTNKEILCVSICAGFPAADIEQVGPSVTITVDVSSENGGKESIISRAQTLAEEFMDYCWQHRDYSSVLLISPDEAVEQAAQFQRDFDETLENVSAKAIIFAEITDNPGSGHYGDATTLLRSLLHGTVTHSLCNVAFYSIYDPEAVRQCIGIGIGGCGWVQVGGRFGIGGEPLLLYGRVVVLSDGRFQAHGPIGGGCWQNMGNSVCLRLSTEFNKPDTLSVGAGVRVSDTDTGSFTGFDLCLVSNKQQALDHAQLLNLGIDPRTKRILVLKSMNHFKADFSQFAKRIALVDGGGLGSVIAGKGDGGGVVYRRARRPIWPLDELVI